MRQEILRTAYPDGTVVLSNIRNNKGVPVFRKNDTYTATKVLKWYDGTPMDDSKADGKVYLKLKSTGEYFLVNLPNWGQSFLEKDSMQAMRDMTPTEVLLLKMGYYKGVKLNGYHSEEPAYDKAVEYYVSATSLPDNGGSVVQVGFLKLAHPFIGEVDIRYFGARPLKNNTDSYDCSPAITNIINSFVYQAGEVVNPKDGINGGKILIPTGRFEVSSRISLKRGVSVQGLSRESSQIISKSLNGVFIYEDNGRYVQDELTFRDFSIWQHKDFVPTSGAGIEITFGNATVLSTQITCENVLIEGTYNGYTLGAGIWSTFKNCNATKCKNHGFELIFLKDGKATSTTSTTFLNCYSSINDKSGFKITRGGYCSFVGCASDSNLEYGYHIEQGLAHSFVACGAEENVMNNMFLDECEGISINADLLYGTTTANRDCVKIRNCKQTLFTGGRLASVSAVGYGINVVSNTAGGKITIIGMDFYGQYAGDKKYNTNQFILDLSSNQMKLANGKFTFGGLNSPDGDTLFHTGGNVSNDVFTGFKATPIFSKPGSTRNIASHIQASTLDSAETYPLLIGEFVANPSKGAQSVVRRTAQKFINETTIGTEANANEMVNVTSGTVPIGQWDRYSESARLSYFKGGFVLGKNNGNIIVAGDGSPEGVLSAKVGSVYINNTASSKLDAVYIKNSGSGSSGWTPLIPQTPNIPDITLPDATDEASDYALTNALKATVNDLVSKLKTAGIVASL